MTKGADIVSKSAPFVIYNNQLISEPKSVPAAPAPSVTSLMESNVNAGAIHVCLGVSNVSFFIIYFFGLLFDFIPGATIMTILQRSIPVSAYITTVFLFCLNYYNFFLMSISS